MKEKAPPRLAWERSRFRRAALGNRLTREVNTARPVSSWYVQNAQGKARADGLVSSEVLGLPPVGDAALQVFLCRRHSPGAVVGDAAAETVVAEMGRVVWTGDMHAGEEDGQQLTMHPKKIPLFSTGNNRGIEIGRIDTRDRKARWS